MCKNVVFILFATLKNQSDPNQSLNANGLNNSNNPIDMKVPCKKILFLSREESF